MARKHPEVMVVSAWASAWAVGASVRVAPGSAAEGLVAQALA